MKLEEKHAHELAMKTKIADVAAVLQEAFGQKLTGFIAGAGDPKTVGRWAGGKSVPRPETAERLRHAFQVHRLLSDYESEETVCAWFIGMNPLLGDCSPAAALREDKSLQVLAAARSFIASG